MKVKYYLFAIVCLFSLNNPLFAQSAEQAPLPPDQSMWQTLVMIAVALLFFYFILWRPEQKRRQALDEQRNTLKKGDRVVAMGIIGTVVKIGEQTVILKMYDGNKIEFFKAAITDIMSESDEGAKRVELISEDHS